MNTNANMMSIFIPHVDASITMEIIACEFYRQEIGVVDRIESIPKVNQKDGHAYHACFVYMRKWSTTYNAQYVQQQLRTGQQVHMYYMINRYWVLALNTSEVAALPIPKHMDLVMHLNAKVTPEHLYSVLEAMDLGKIRHLQITPLTHEEETVMWKGANPEKWIQVVPVTYHKVSVQFDYWYHTKSADLFQRELSERGLVSVPVDIHTVWDMYQKIPVYPLGKNPYIWYNYDTELNKHIRFREAASRLLAAEKTDEESNGVLREMRYMKFQDQDQPVSNEDKQSDGDVYTYKYDPVRQIVYRYVENPINGQRRELQRFHIDESESINDEEPEEDEY